MKNFKAPSDIRPTTSKARLAIFNILRSEWGYLQGKTCLDLFAGSGSLGLTALKEGADSLICVDSSFASCSAIKENAQNLHLEKRVQIIKADIFKFKTQNTFDLIFADPPYKIEIEKIDKLLNLIPSFLSREGLFILELKDKTPFNENPINLNLKSKKVYGDSGFWLWEKKILINRPLAK